MKFKNHTANEVVEKFKDIVISNNLIWKIKGIITDRAKNLVNEEKWKYLLKHKFIFVILVKPQQKQLIEHMNSEFRYWLPKGTDFNNVSQKMIDWIVNVINDKLESCFTWIIAKAMFLQNIK